MDPRYTSETTVEKVAVNEKKMSPSSENKRWETEYCGTGFPRLERIQIEYSKRWCATEIVCWRSIVSSEGPSSQSEM